MAYLASEVISNAWYLSAIVARGLETVSGDQGTDGLRLLNALLSFQAVTGRLIPYYQTYSLTAVAGQEKYFIQNLIDIEAFTFNINTVRFPSSSVRRKRYFGSGRANNVRSLPVTHRVERTKGGADLYVYFLPNTTYPLNFIGKFGLTAVTADTDLSTAYDTFYISYLEYSLANRMCADYALPVPAGTQALLAENEQTLRDLSPMDLSMQKISTLQRGSSFNYATANLGKGWQP